MADCAAIDAGTTAWMMTSMAFVLFMTPGLAFFYGGLVSRKSVLTIIMQCVISMGLVAVLWLIIGFSLAFGQSGGGFIGNPDSYFMLWNLDPCTPVGFPMQSGPGNYPGLLFAGYQMMFAIICPALITGAFADRVKFTSYLMFISIWLLLVYCPFAHWVWNPEGYLGKWGVKDFAGGIVVHVSAGFAALASVFVVGSRTYETPEEREAAHTPHNRTFVALGTGMLWFGWFGFNGGSALAADGVAVFAIVNTSVACAMAMCCWVVIEWLHVGKPTIVGACVGAIAGLATITPCAGFIRPWAAFLIGWIASWFCYSCILLCKRMGWDDALDVWAVHGMGGFIGSMLLGALADEGVGGQERGWKFFGKQVAATLLCTAYSFIVSFVLLKLVDVITPGGIRPSDEDIRMGLDVSMHGENAYDEDAVKAHLRVKADDAHEHLHPHNNTVPVAVTQPEVLQQPFAQPAAAPQQRSAAPVQQQQQPQYGQYPQQSFPNAPVPGMYYPGMASQPQYMQPQFHGSA